MKIGYDAKRAFHNTSGLGNYSRDLLRILFKHRPEQEYFLFNPKASKRELFQYERNERIHEIMPSSPLHQIIHPIWRSKAVIGECKSRKLDIYHGLSNELPIGIGKSKIKSIVSIHDLIFMRLPKLYRKTDRLIYRAKFEQACKEADKIIAISEQTASDIIKYLKISSSKIEVVHQGCQPEFQKEHSTQSLEKVKEQYSLPDRFLLGVGTLEKRKNQGIIIRAMAELKENIPVVLVGKPTSYKIQLQKLSDELGLSGMIHYLSDVPTEDLARIFKLAEVLLYPSVFEGFGIPILEGLSSGIPVVTSEDSCFHEAGGNAALYINPYEHRSLVKALEEILNDERSRMERIEAGKKHFQNFSEDKIANNLSAVYDI